MTYTYTTKIYKLSITYVAKSHIVDKAKIILRQI